jgi:hypothetical protein
MVIAQTPARLVPLGAPPPGQQFDPARQGSTESAINGESSGTRLARPMSSAAMALRALGLLAFAAILILVVLRVALVAAGT